MTLLDPFWLAVAASGIFIVALHARQRETITTPSVQLWKQLSARRTSQRKRSFPRISLALVLQLAIAALIALSLAEPVSTPRDAEPSHRIYVLDLNTDPENLRESTGRIERELANDPAAPTRRVSLAVASAKPVLLLARLADGEGLSHLLNSLRAEDAQADWEGVAARIKTTLVQNEHTDIRVATRAPSLSALETITGKDVTLRIDRTDAPTLAKMRLASFSATPRSNKAAGPWRIAGVLPSEPNEPVDLLFQPDRAPTFLPWGEVKTDSSGAFNIDLDMSGPGMLQARARNVPLAHLALNEPGRRIKVLIVGDEDPALNRALNASQRTTVFRVASLPAVADQFDLVIADNAVLPRHPRVNTLWIGSARLASDPPTVKVSDPTPTFWDDTHLLSAGVAWDLLKVAVTQADVPMAGATVLVSAGDLPLVQVRNGVFGKEVRIAFDPRESNWTELTAFPVFLSNVLEGLGVSVEASASCNVGVACWIPRSWMRQDTRLTGPGGESIGLGATAFLKTTGHWAPDDLDDSFIPTVSGLYRLSTSGRDMLIAANDFARPNVDNLDAPSHIPNAEVSKWTLWIPLAALAALLLVFEAVYTFGGRTGWQALRAHLAFRIVALTCIALSLLETPLPFLRMSEILISITTRDEGSRPLADQLVSGLIVASDQLDSTLRLGSDAVRSANFEEAIEVASAMIPPGRRGRIDVATALDETRGSLSQTLPSLLKRGLKIDVTPIEADPTQIEMTEVLAPRRMHAGDSAKLTALITSDAARHTTVTVYRNGIETSHQLIELQPGANRVEATIGESEAGRAFYEMATEGSNMRAGVFVDVGAAPTIAIIAPDEQRQAAAGFAEIMKEQGLQPVVIMAKNAPWSMKDWLRYDVVALLNLPAIDLDTRQQEMIETAVRQHGRGLMILGGENTFGPGGYFGTPLERLSPLSARVPKDALQAAMVFVLDRSGSMIQQAGEGTRLDLAKSATRSAIDLLHDESRIAIVTFDSEAHTILPLQKKNLATAAEALAPVAPGGGTAIYPGLVEAELQLRDDDSKIRHVVVMTDGLTQPGDFAGIIGRLREQGATVSGLAIGDSADPATVQEIARLGGGSFHVTRDFRALPGILAREAMMLSGDPAKIRSAKPEWMDRTAPFLSGMPDDLPSVQGYVPTTAKPAAKLHLAIPEDDGPATPLLASWRYGAGRVLSLATHAVGEWVQDWQAQPSHPLFWAQAVRSFVPETAPQGLELELKRRYDNVDIVLHSNEPDGSASELSDVRAVLTKPILAEKESTPNEVVELTSQLPGERHGHFTIDRAGDYVVRATRGDASIERALHVGPPTSIDRNVATHAILGAMSAATGGVEHAPGASAPDRGYELAWRRVWRGWLLLALFAFLLDLTLRYAPKLLRLRP